jgi:hypothetical protein
VLFLEKEGPEGLGIKTSEMRPDGSRRHRMRIEIHLFYRYLALVIFWQTKRLVSCISQFGNRNQDYL